MKFTFVSEDEPVVYVDNVSAKRTFVFEADSLSQILEQFENFLRGSGFHINGYLDIVSEEDDSESYIDHYDPNESEQVSLCPVCKIDTNIMKNNICYDKNCPTVK